MATAHVFIAVSLDGFIARPDGDIDGTGVDWTRLGARERYQPSRRRTLSFLMPIKPIRFPGGNRGADPGCFRRHSPNPYRSRKPFATDTTF